jgi:hypothetical protein
MAHDITGSLRAFAPAGGHGSAKAQHMVVLPIRPSIPVQAGDVLVVDYTAAGNPDVFVDNDDPRAVATQFIMGIALLSPSYGLGASAPVSPATINRDGDEAIEFSPGGSLTPSVVSIALAYPGSRFEGNIVAGANDATGVYNTDLRKQYDVISTDDAAGGYAAIDNTDVTNPCIAVEKYVAPQVLRSTGVWQHGRAAGVGILNPRVEFVFMTSATVFA